MAAKLWIWEREIHNHYTITSITYVFVLASNHFQKCFSINASVWLRMENKFSRKYFQLTVCFNGFDPKIGFSQNFHFKPFLDSRTTREREREREREAEERAQITPSTLSIYEPTNRSSTQSLRPTDLRTHKPIFNLEPLTHEPSTSPATQSLRAMNPQTDLSLCVILIDPWTNLRFCVILIFYSLFDL